jgi:hypothetical protein
MIGSDVTNEGSMDLAAAHTEFNAASPESGFVQGLLNETGSGDGISVGSGSALVFDRGIVFQNAGGVSNEGSLIMDAGTFISEASGTVAGHDVVIKSGILEDNGGGTGGYDLQGDSTLSGDTIGREQTITIQPTDELPDPTATLAGAITNNGKIVLDCGPAAGTADLTASQLTTIANNGTFETSGQGSCSVYNAAVTNSGLMQISGAHTEFGFGSVVTNQAGVVKVETGAQTVFDPGCTFANDSGKVQNDGSILINGTFGQGSGAVTGNPVVVDRGAMEITGNGKGQFDLESSSTLGGATIYAGQTITLLSQAQEGATASVQNNMTNRGAIIVDCNHGQAQIAGSFTLANAGRLSTAGTNACGIDLNVTNIGSMDLEAMDNEVGGAYQLVNSGTLQLGDLSTLTFPSGGSFAQRKDGNLVVRANGSQCSQVTGYVSVSLAGTLSVKAVTPPAAGSRCTIISGSTLSGKFNTVNAGRYSAQYTEGSPGAVTLKA